MISEMLVLGGTAASIGFIHTVLGPDHYLPFIAMSKARGWSGRKTAIVTLLCGLGHVMSSIILGLVGVSLGIVVFRLESVESSRGDLAGWILIAFGLIYLLWGIRRAVRERSHDHRHGRRNGEPHSHHHSHIGGHSHIHGSAATSNLTPWVLFTIFLLGPCEPLIPLIMYPAAKSSVWAVVAVAMVFGLVTILTMFACVMVSYYGLSKVSLPHVERYSHALAGLTVLLCGGAIKFLGL
ncbi:MAG: sulfite exporter TauE/SafE family protein [Thermodesulfobacteriota bacterium]|nr:sulfite exporter TauE/SafE family protein [Thermodesulfobacteriota bacterium]